ncbi:MAG: hypothetical protein C4523_00285 [Myxococcales bacterium]|nr:MAG: hypothetical protein C4523_00285 [Myxococcales bacterium]
MVFVAMALIAAGCAQKATPQQCESVCQKQLALAQAANPTPADDPVAAVEADFQKKLAEAQAPLMQAVQAVEAELQAKLGQAKNDEEKKALIEEYNKKKNEKAQEFAPAIQTLAQEKEQKIAAAQGAKKAAEEAQKAAEEKQLAECKDSCGKTTTAPKAECQLKAADLNAFNACK